MSPERDEAGAVSPVLESSITQNDFLQASQGDHTLESQFVQPDAVKLPKSRSTAKKLILRAKCHSRSIFSQWSQSLSQLPQSQSQLRRRRIARTNETIDSIYISTQTIQRDQPTSKFVDAYQEFLTQSQLTEKKHQPIDNNVLSNNPQKVHILDVMTTPSQNEQSSKHDLMPEVLKIALKQYRDRYCKNSFTQTETVAITSPKSSQKKPNSWKLSQEPDEDIISAAMLDIEKSFSEDCPLQEPANSMPLPTAKSRQTGFSTASNKPLQFSKSSAERLKNIFNEDMSEIPHNSIPTLPPPPSESSSTSLSIAKTGVAKRVADIFADVPGVSNISMKGNSFRTGASLTSSNSLSSKRPASSRIADIFKDIPGLPALPKCTLKSSGFKRPKMTCHDDSSNVTPDTVSRDPEANTNVIMCERTPTKSHLRLPFSPSPEMQKQSETMGRAPVDRTPTSINTIDVALLTQMSPLIINSLDDEDEKFYQQLLQLQSTFIDGRSSMKNKKQHSNSKRCRRSTRLQAKSSSQSDDSQPITNDSGIEHITAGHKRRSLIDIINDDRPFDCQPSSKVVSYLSFNECLNHRFVIMSQSATKEYWNECLEDVELTVCDRFGTVGFREFLSSFLSRQCVDLQRMESTLKDVYEDNLTKMDDNAYFFRKWRHCEEWVASQYRLIIWKLMAYERAFPHHFPAKSLLNMETVMKLMLPRYKKRFEKISEAYSAFELFRGRLVPVSARFVCCVCAIKLGEFVELLVTDGHEMAACSIDGHLAKLVRSGKIRVGFKLCVCNADIISAEGMDDKTYLKGVFPTTRLKLYANCCRLATWDAKLGVQSQMLPIQLPLMSCLPGGGVLPRIRCIVARVYPLIYVHTNSSGQLVHSQTIPEQVLAKRNAPTSLPSLQELKAVKDNPGKLFGMLKSCGDSAETLFERLDDVQRQQLIEYNKNEARTSILSDTSNNICGKNENKISCLFKFIVIGLNTRDVDNRTSALVTVDSARSRTLKPTALADGDLVVEGRCVELSGFSMSSSRGGGGAGRSVELTTTRVATIEALSSEFHARQRSLIDVVFEARRPVIVAEMPSLSNDAVSTPLVSSAVTNNSARSTATQFCNDEVDVVCRVLTKYRKGCYPGLVFCCDSLGAPFVVKSFANSTFDELIARHLACSGSNCGANTSLNESVNANNSSMVMMSDTSMCEDNTDEDFVLLARNVQLSRQKFRRFPIVVAGPLTLLRRVVSGNVLMDECYKRQYELIVDNAALGTVARNALDDVLMVTPMTPANPSVSNHTQSNRLSTPLMPQSFKPHSTLAKPSDDSCSTNKRMEYLDRVIKTADVKRTATTPERLSTDLRPLTPLNRSATAPTTRTIGLRKSNRKIL